MLEFPFQYIGENIDYLDNYDDRQLKLLGL